MVQVFEILLVLFLQVWLHGSAVPASVSGLYELQRGLHLHSGGTSTVITSFTGSGHTGFTGSGASCTKGAYAQKSGVRSFHVKDQMYQSEMTVEMCSTSRQLHGWRTNFSTAVVLRLSDVHI